jgi:amidase
MATRAGAAGDDDGCGGAFTERFVLRHADAAAAAPKNAPDPPPPSLPLRGLTVSIKDLYDVAGHRTGFGSPSWLATRGARPAAQHAAAVARLLDAGATLVGKTSMCELAYSLDGANAHWGAPANPAAPGRVPGGSSSGAASAVAQGLCDASLGSDTGGSVRVPASCCGVFGIRPTHGRVPMAPGARALAPSFDTGGWLARDAATLRRVGTALLTPPAPRQPSSFFRPRPRWLVARDAFALASPSAARALYAPLAARIEAVSAVLGGPPREVDLAPAPSGGEGEEDEGDDAEEQEEEDGGSISSGGSRPWRADLSSLSGWADVFRVAQAREIWREHGAWVEETRLRGGPAAFGPGTDARLRMAATISEADARRAGRARARVAARLDALLGADGVLVLPSAPGPAIRLGAPAEELNAWRSRVLALTCAAGLAGLPQVSLPVGRVAAAEEGEEEGEEGEGEAAERGGEAGAGAPPPPLLPVGLGLIGPRGSDEALLELAERLMAVLEGGGAQGDD